MWAGKKEGRIKGLELGLRVLAACYVARSLEKVELNRILAFDETRIHCAQIQGVMVEYFKKRQGPIAKAGIGALKKSLAAIYYLPFQCGVNLFFRFSGQSIPNRCVQHLLAGVSA